MSTVTVVATVESSTGPQDPPRVRLNVTDTGTSPALFSATVTRLDPDGRVVPVRTSDGNPLVLSTSGSNRTGLVYDYEMPYGAPVTYSTMETPGSSSAAVTVDEPNIWLVHPGVPELSMPVELRAGSLAEEEWGVQQGVFFPMGREFPVVQTDGSRKAAQSSLTVAISSRTDLDRIRALVSDAGTLLLNVPDSLNLGIDTAYIAVGAIRNVRPSDIGSVALRDIVMPFQVVDRPAGGSQSERTYVDVLAQFSTYAAVRNSYANYTALLAGP
jgi:hypothetical protein